MKLYTANVILNDIKNEITRLKNCGYLISICKINDVFKPFFSELCEYTTHQCKFCYSLKAKHNSLSNCIENKNKLEAKDIYEPYFSSCYAGIEEFVIPITMHGEILMYIEVYGYKNNSDNSRKKLLNIKNIVKNDFDSITIDLKDEIPSIDEIVLLVTPLSFMLREFYRACRNLSERETYIDKIYRESVKIMNEHSHELLSVDEIAKEIGYSPSYIKSIFQKHGESVAETYRKIRLNKASDLLLISSYSITEIAMLTGFSDSANFATVFKKYYGKTPREYRKKTV